MMWTNTIRPMTPTIWAKCKKLSPNRGNWGEPMNIDAELILTLDAALQKLGLDVFVTSGTAGSHTKGSLHYPAKTDPGRAIDFMIPSLERKDLPDVFFELCRYNFGGIGLYASWKLAEGKPMIGGFHVDSREGDRKALWMKGFGKSYLPFTIRNLNELFT